MTEPKIGIYDFDNYFEGISGITKSNAIVADENLKIAIVGKQKVGKSWLTTTAPQPILIYDFDGRAESIRDKPGVAIKTLKDESQANPNSMKVIESDLSTFKYRKQQGKPIPRTFGFDSVTYMKKFIENELMSQMGPGYYRVVRVTPTTSLRIPQGWDVINGVEGYLLYLISEFSALGNIIFVFHEKNEKDVAESTEKLTKYTSQYTVDPQYLAKILSKFNEVFRIEIDSSQNYIVTCKPSYEFNASTTLLIDAKEKPNLMDMIAKHKQRLELQNKK